jgi:hypothetical protein
LIEKPDFDEIFFKMQVISVAFRIAMSGFRNMGYELLGMPRRAVWWNLSGLSHENQ